MNIYLKTHHHRVVFSPVFLLVLVICSGAVFAQDHSGEALKPLTPSDYGKWESVRGAEFSENGKWLSVIRGTNQGDRTLILNDLDSGSETVFTDVNGITYSPDNKWVILRRTLPGKDMERIREVNGKVEARAWLYSLESKDTLDLNNLKSYQFSNDGAFLALTRERDNGNALLIRNMETGKEISFGNVQAFEWNDKNNLILFKVENHKGDNEIQLYNPETGTIRLLDSHENDYTVMRWLENSNEAMIIKERVDEAYEEASHDVILLKGLDKDNYEVVSFEPHEMGVLDADVRVLAEDIEISEDHHRLYFSIHNRTRKYDKAPEEVLDTLLVMNEGHSEDLRPVYYNRHDEAPDLQIWHSKDPVLVPAQNMTGMNGFDTPKTATWDFKSEKLTVLQDELLEKVNIQAKREKFLGYDDTPYVRQAMFGRHFYDVYAVDSQSGDRSLLVQGVSKYYDLSPDSRYFVYLKDNALFLFDIRSGQSVNLTSGLEADFIDHHNDHPVPQKPAHGFVGWVHGGKSFLLNSEFDVWQFFTDGRAPRRLTPGRENENIYRLDSTAKDDGLIRVNAPLIYRVEGKWTKKTGYASGKPGEKLVTHIFEDAGIRRIACNKETGQIVFIRSSYDLPGDAFYTADQFKTEKQLTHINAFQEEYQWSKAALVEFKTSRGNRAQGVLYYPANYVPGEKYPMITYVYEKLSHGLHNYMQPSENDYYNTLLWVQSGYFVFKPDMEFEAGNPGVSAARTLENAVGAVVAMGDVDAQKVGLIGHSWGGYQAGFVPTQTDIFAASVAGAGLTDLISMNLAVTPAFGWHPENDHFEVGQERMEVAPWLAPDKYVANSSVMQVHKLNTPVMFMVGDSDANVNWSQGIEYYNAARRAGKEFVMLVYENEGHSLSRKKNQIDYQQRILKWFDYHLKGMQPEDWMISSVPYSDQKERLQQWNN